MSQHTSENNSLLDQYKQDSDLSKLLSNLDKLGEDEQKEAGESLEALKRPVKEMMQDQSNQLPKQLHQLKETVSQLEPSHLQASQTKKWLNKLLRRNPIEQYARKYKTVEAQVDSIVEGLLSGKDKLQEDNLMLQQLKETATKRIHNLNEQIAIGQQLNKMLEDEMIKEQWADNPNELKKGQLKVTSRVKNMSQAVMVLQQSLASVDLIVENNDKLEEAIFNAITMTKNVITVSASIQLALSNQQKVIKAVKNVNEATESMLLSNSELLKQNTEETLKTLEEPAIAIESFRKAYNNVFEAIELTEKSNERIVQSGQEFIKELDTLNKEMQTKLLN
ncbi:toxic anion resistance protein [Halalkalibacter krulwichiae]|uniref:Toxic anion resistance protein (TelA) n=1 Tax=Halalkalibacter krulwichiae TaxID=199441 RepID=A0A1X9MAD9_9BACI|nr:toxic anion resistance protein [Halalkalibacter krulwichiae]ARK30376.1 Toxic anion resistance protein (TelA) [Halalkalibacter krulwichiae]